jgi:hypothetical protein
MVHLVVNHVVKCVFVTCLMVIACHSAAQSQPGKSSLPYYLMPDYSDVGRKLPSGVPRDVDTNGNVIYVRHTFTTGLYQKAALKLVLHEANSVAEELNLTNDIPVTESNLVEFHISPFGFAYAFRRIGFVATRNYSYYVSLGDKFSFLEGTHQLENCQRYLAGYTWPVSRIDTNAAYQLATQCLSAVHMDVKALNRDCHVATSVDTSYVQAPPGKFVPIYWIAWIPKNGESTSAAEVRLFLPTKTLLQLRVEDPKYILRHPLAFTNLAALFPGVATISTNYPVKTISVPAPPP